MKPLKKLINDPLVGNYITSLEMAGVSLSLLCLDEELTELWDGPVHTSAWRKGI